MFFKPYRHVLTYTLLFLVRGTSWASGCDSFCSFQKGAQVAERKDHGMQCVSIKLDYKCMIKNREGAGIKSSGFGW